MAVAEREWKPDDKPKRPEYRKLLDRVEFGEPTSLHWEREKLRLETALAEDLVDAIGQFNRATTTLSQRVVGLNRWLVALTVVLVVLTAVLVVLGWQGIRLGTSP